MVKSICVEFLPIDPNQNRISILNNTRLNTNISGITQLFHQALLFFKMVFFLVFNIIDLIVSIVQAIVAAIIAALLKILVDAMDKSNCSEVNGRCRCFTSESVDLSWDGK